MYESQGNREVKASMKYLRLSGAVCAPSRACVHIGIPIFRATIGKDMTNREHSSVIRPEVRLMPQTMREAEYQTHAIGKWHNDKASFARSFEGGDKLYFHGMSEHTQVPVYDYVPTGAYPKEQEYMENTFSTESCLRTLQSALLRDTGWNGRCYCMWLIPRRMIREPRRSRMQACTTKLRVSMTTRTSCTLRTMAWRSGSTD
ncbi:sulfatase-like hydrolase/transferase [Paenibacillus sp. FSL H7-0331]|uniref:sulfatase-like hydrolase/transferase n=1 Tax=Paenibacillus sp. FSL H7-0331 TaxID=1920421 RepID=UPI00096CE090|nr:sulfatase-like hydrolase/transferase [Paenibacillus sp. FSL H7-0331]OMF02681.1 hypothetical protein BK127_36880 [Paenibacillus sp. FSL H7-0331]